ncbi:MAG TPA: hypothetical protein VGH11_16950 [Jatrophihabitans sp.]|jgi:hypothetical protein
MQGWIVAGAWLFAVLLALVVLGFAGYELRWKTRRLQTDRAELDGLVAELAATAARLQTAGNRARAARSAGVATRAAGSSATPTS